MPERALHFVGSPDANPETETFWDAAAEGTVPASGVAPIADRRTGIRARCARSASARRPSS